MADGKHQILGRTIDTILDNRVKLTSADNETVGSDNGLPVTPYHADGTEGNLISGVQWVSGKSGIDQITNVLMSIDYQHHEIHAGSTFRVQHNDTIGNGGELVIAFFVPDQAKQPHIVWEFVHEGSMTMTVYEGVTFNASAGTDRAPKNSNRNSSNTSVVQGKATGSLVSDYVTVGDDGDSIYSGGSVISLKKDYATRNTAGGGERKNEIVLKTNTNYAFVLSNNETSAQGGQIRLEWYEHTPKNV